MKRVGEVVDRPRPARVRRVGDVVALSVAGLLAAVGGVFVIVGVSQAGPPPAPVRARGAIPSPRTSPVPGTARLIAASPPVGLSIPAIGVSTSVTPLGLNRDATVAVPTSYHRAGWYRFSPSPGQVGPAVILGHVDSRAGPGVFYRLGALRPGDRILVTLADRVVVTFSVDAVTSEAKSAFPTQAVYGNVDYPGLRLITCGGQFDQRTGHYLRNIVVFASLIQAVRRAPAG